MGTSRQLPWIPKGLGDLMESNKKWDQRFLGMAEHIAQWSRDPSTKVGAVVVRPNRTIVSLGFNGFPRGVDDAEERYNDRELKYKLVVHAEANALAAANEDLAGCTIYTFPFPPCSSCAGMIIQSGIQTVIAPEPTPEQIERWGESLRLSCEMFAEAGLTYVTY